MPRVLVFSSATPTRTDAARQTVAELIPKLHTLARIAPWYLHAVVLLVDRLLVRAN